MDYSVTRAKEPMKYLNAKNLWVQEHSCLNRQQRLCQEMEGYVNHRIVRHHTLAEFLPIFACLVCLFYDIEPFYPHAIVRQNPTLFRQRWKTLRRKHKLFNFPYLKSRSDILAIYISKGPFFIGTLVFLSYFLQRCFFYFWEAIFDNYLVANHSLALLGVLTTMVPGEDINFLLFWTDFRRL